MQIFDVLNGYGIEYVIIGGHAVNFHGYIRTTEDIDIIIDPVPANRKRLLSALKSINAYWIRNEIDPDTGMEKTEPITESFVLRTHMMMLGADLGFIDIFDFIPGFPEENIEKVFATSESLENLRFISLDWLIKIKEKSARDRDLEDIEKLKFAAAGTQSD